VEKEKILMRKLEKKIDMLVGDYGKRHDSKRWYYLPSNINAPRAGRAHYDKDEADEGYKKI